MKIVASTKMNQAQRSMAEARVYGQTSNSLFENAETKPTGGKTLYVVSSSDKGLCGGIHSSLSKAVRLKLAENPDADVCVMGEKCRAQLSRSHPQNMALSFAGIGKDLPSFAVAQTVANEILSLGNDYDTIEIVYNNYKSPVSYEAETIDAFSESTILASGIYPSCFPSPFG